MKSLRILMVAPQPFLRPRGTPFSVYHRIRALLRLGHRVDLLTYPFGEDVDLPGLRILRSPRPFGVRDVRIGPSFAKLMLDIPLFRLAWKTAHRREHDLLHTHEEAGWIGAALRKRLPIPHLYDMHSSLPQQFENFGRLNLRPVVESFERLERYTLGAADGVIAICPALEDRARESGYAGPLEMIENTMDFDPVPATEEDIQRLRERLDLVGAPVIVYTGTLERYQGLDLLLDAGALLAGRRPEARILIVGGTEEQSAALRAQAVACGAGSNTVMLPAVPPQEVSLYLRLADMLVTTRARGTNTPLKIYQYLRSGRPIVATGIFSHTQVLDPSCAELVDPDPASIAAGIERLLDDEGRRDQLARAASELARDRYGEERYMEMLERLLHSITNGADPASRAAD